MLKVFCYSKIKLFITKITQPCWSQSIKFETFKDNKLSTLMLPFFYISFNLNIVVKHLFVVQGLLKEQVLIVCISVIFWGCTCTPCTPMFRRHSGVESNGWVWVQNCKVIVLKQRFSRTLDILAVYRCLERISHYGAKNFRKSAI